MYYYYSLYIIFYSIFFRDYDIKLTYKDNITYFISENVITKYRSNNSLL